MESLWQRTCAFPRFPRLQHDLKTGVLIIGGGLAGLLCAYRLHETGVPYALVEAERICGGVSGGTTAKLTAQHGLIYDKLVRRFGIELAKHFIAQGARELLAKAYEMI